MKPPYRRLLARRRVAKQDESSSDTTFSAALTFLKENLGILTSTFLLLGAIQVLIYYNSIGYLLPGLSLSDLTVIFALVAAISITQILTLAVILISPALIYRLMKWKPNSKLFRKKVDEEEVRDLFITWMFIAFTIIGLVILVYIRLLPQLPVLTISCVVIGLIVALMLIREWETRKGQPKRERSSQQDQKRTERSFAIAFSGLYGLFLNSLILLWLVQLIDGGTASEPEKIVQFLLTVVFLQGITLTIWIFLPNWQWRIVASSLVVILPTTFVD